MPKDHILMNMSPTSVELYQGTRIGEVTPLADAYIAEKVASDPPALDTCDLPSLDLSAISTLQCKELLAFLVRQTPLPFASQYTINLWPNSQSTMSLEIRRCCNREASNTVLVYGQPQ